VISSLYLTQKLGENVNTLFGKINVVDLLANDNFFGGWGTRRCMNIAFVAPPSGVLPPTIFGSITSIKTTDITWNLMVYDPADHTTEAVPNKLFADGVNMALSGTHAWQMAGRATSYTLGATYSTESKIDLKEQLLSEDLRTESKKGSYNINTQFSHALYEFSSRAGDNWGAVLKMGLSDGNPNPIRGLVVAGIGGRSFISNRPNDGFGVGYYYYDFSNDLQSAVRPVARFNDEHGIEAYYDYAVTPWLHITADVQRIDPANGDNDNALVAGLRSNIRF
jgi:porin